MQHLADVKVLRAQTRATGNVSPQLITAKLIRELSATLR